MTTTDRWAQMGAGYARRCWDAVDQPHRAVVMQALADLAPFGGVLELGCNAGVNLRLIRARWPEVKVGGIDVNASAIRHALHHLPDAWPLVEDDLVDALPAFEDASVDVILTCYALAYVHPDVIVGALWNMARVARRGLVIAEPMVVGASVCVHTGLEEHAHDYRALLAELAPGVATLRPVAPVQRLNSVLTWRLSPDSA